LEAQGQSVTVEHSDVQVDEGLPLTMFDAPDNIKFVELPNTKKPLETSPVPRKITRPKVTMASGTGFFITEDGYLLTNYHVVEDAKRLEVRTGGQILPAKLFKCDYTNDIAVLKVCGTFPSLPIGSSSMVHLGDSVFTIGFPNISIQGIEPKFTRGEISSVAGIKDDPRWFQISVAVQPGNSGGPLIDQSGNVIGIIVARLDALRMLTETGSLPQNVNYAIKISLAAPLLEKVHEVSAKARISGATKRRVETIIENAKQAIVLVVSYP